MSQTTVNIRMDISIHALLAESDLFLQTWR